MTQPAAPSIKDALLYRWAMSMLIIVDTARDMLAAKTNSDNATSEQTLQAELQKLLVAFPDEVSARMLAALEELLYTMAPGVDLSAENITISINRKEEKIVLRGHLNPQKLVTMALGKDNAIALEKSITQAVDMLWPQRLVGLTPPKLIGGL